MGDLDDPTNDDGMTKTDLADERTELARKRTDDAASRTVLANERTFSAWLRTALSGIGLGLAVPRLLSDARTVGIAAALGLILIVLGVAAGVLAAYRYHNVSQDLEAAGHELTPRWITAAIVAGITLVGVLAVILVLMQ